MENPNAFLTIFAFSPTKIETCENTEFAPSPSEARFLTRGSATNWRSHSKNVVFFFVAFFPVLILKTPVTTFAGGRGPREAENVNFLLVLCVCFFGRPRRQERRT